MSGRLLGVLCVAAALTGSARAQSFVAAQSWSQVPQVKVFDGSGAEQSSFYAAPAERVGGIALAGGNVVAVAGSFGRPDVVELTRAGDVVRSFTAARPSYGGGASVAAGDLTGDGRADLVTGADGAAALWDGATGRQLWATSVGTNALPVRVAVGGGVVAAAALTTVRVYDARGTRLVAFSAGDAAGALVFVAAGDLDGDGVPEIVVGADGAGLPQVQVFDGRTGDRRASFRPFDTSVTSVPVAVADVSGDARPELLAGAIVGGVAQVRALDAQGRDAGFTLSGAAYGSSLVLGAGDGDVAVAADDGYESAVHVFGRDAKERVTLTPFEPSPALHVAFADVDRDGSPEVVTTPGPGERPQLRVFDRAGNVARAYDALDPVLRDGVSVAVADVDGDGRVDAVAAPEQGCNSTVRVLDGRSGSVAASFDAFPAGACTGARVAAGDLVGDGAAEIVVGATYGAPEVKVFDGAGRPLGSFLAFDGRDGGISVAAGDVFGEGRSAIVVGSQAGSPQIRVFRGAGLLASSFAVPDLCCNLRVAVVDLDGDGRGEILASGSAPDGLVEAFAADGRRVATFHLFPGGYGPVELAAAPRVNSPVPTVTPPTMPVVRGPRWTRNRTPAYRFASHDLDGPDALIRYRCSFDSYRLHACRARYAQALRPGRHVLRVAAVDDEGAQSATATVRVVVAR